MDLTALDDTSIEALCTSPPCDAPTPVESVVSKFWVQTKRRRIPVAPVQNRSWSVALPSALMAPASYHGHGGDQSADDGGQSGNSSYGHGGGCRVSAGWQLEGAACGLCHTTETPQWRTGPDGPGTLCNACDIRYRMAVDGYLAEHGHRRVPTTRMFGRKSRGAVGRW
ncbi:hypothetical protein ACQ4PT_051391 [Festuca glaucescens]